MSLIRPLTTLSYVSTVINRKTDTTGNEYYYSNLYAGKNGELMSTAAQNKFVAAYETIGSKDAAGNGAGLLTEATKVINGKYLAEDITLPKGLTFVEGSAEVGSICVNNEASYNEENGVFVVLAKNFMKDATFTDTKGDFASFQIQADETFVDGSEILIKNVHANSVVDGSPPPASPASTPTSSLRLPTASTSSTACAPTSCSAA